MSERFTLVPPRDPQLNSVNGKIAGLIAVKPWADLYAAFSLVAQLAALGIEAAEELQQMPGASVRILQPTVEFWKQVRDLNEAAALACAGENHTLAEALVTFRFLQNAAGDIPDAS